MNEGKRVILHITFDGVYFDQIYPRFEEMVDYENRYLLHSLGLKRQFRFIKNSDKIICVESLEEWGRIVGDPSIDIIYLHGLWYTYFKAFDFIRPNVIVMWWCYGMEIYENSLRWPPLLPLKILKPKTHQFYLTNMMSLRSLAKEVSRAFPRLTILFIKAYNLVKGKRVNELEYVLKRIDYAFTPLEMEMNELKKRYPFFRAKPFKIDLLVEKDSVPIHSSVGSILLEHSANITNNHLDIIKDIKRKKLDLNKRIIYIPLSYGEKKVAQRVKKDARFDDVDVRCLMDPLPYKDYNDMISSCTHAIFGMIRQSGLGNIFLCLRKGIKMFFYKDGILYKHFKAQGFYVFSIEDDLNASGIIEPLSIAQAKYNYDKFFKIYVSTNSYQQQFNEILKDEF